MNIYQKLADIRRMATVVEKSKRGYGYTYAPEEEVLANVTAGMNKNNVSLIPRILSYDVTPHTYTKRKFAKDGTQLPDDIVNEILVSGEIEYTWVNDENPDETVVVPWMFVGQQSDASQSFGSGTSYSQRYFLLKYFQSAAVDGDVDEYRSKQKEREEAEEREAAKAIVDMVHTAVTAFLKKFPDQKSKVATLVRKHVIIDGKGSADYYKLTNPDAATALKEAVTEFVEKNSKQTKKEEVKNGVSE